MDLLPKQQEIADEGLRKIFQVLFNDAIVGPGIEKAQRSSLAKIDAALKES